MIARWNTLGLRWNPFGEMSLEERVHTTVSPLALPDVPRVQLLGRGGRGKSTQLLHAWWHTPGALWVYLPPGYTALPEAAAAHTGPLFVDEAQRLTHAAQRALWRRESKVVVCTHDDLAARAPGPVANLAVASAGPALQAVVTARLAWAAVDGAPPLDCTAWVTALETRFSDDKRRALGVLYAAFQAARQDPAVLERPLADTWLAQSAPSEPAWHTWMPAGIVALWRDSPWAVRLRGETPRPVETRGPRPA